jgi:two-component system, OmpR family, phosphate regulon sensor histidine kinase PhoR
MSKRPSLSWPITLGVIMIVLIVLVIVGWVFMSIFGALGDDQRAAFYWTWLPIGSILLIMILVGVVLYLTLSIQAINLNERQSNFIDSVTHELKSPIASLKLYLQTLTRRPLAQEEREKFYREMLEDVDRLDELINSLLDVARLDRGETEGAEEELPLAEMLSHCAQLACRKHNVSEQVVSITAEPCTVLAHRVDLEMLFRNLIDNAIKYGGEVPEVQVVAKLSAGGRADREQVIVQVIDNGRGIPHQLRRRIFGRFVRLGVELQREKPGIGLGLYLVRTLVDRLRGKIRVLDRPGGNGSMFEVQLRAKRV